MSTKEKEPKYAAPTQQMINYVQEHITGDGGLTYLREYNISIAMTDNGKHMKDKGRRVYCSVEILNDKTQHLLEQAGKPAEVLIIFDGVWWLNDADDMDRRACALEALCFLEIGKNGLGTCTYDIQVHSTVYRRYGDWRNRKRGSQLEKVVQQRMGFYGQVPSKNEGSVTSATGNVTDGADLVVDQTVKIADSDLV